MKEIYVPARMSEDMALELDEKIEILDIKGRSEAIRQAVKMFLKSDQPQIKKSLLMEFHQWRKEFHNVGININQVAYKLNIGHPLSDEQLIEVQLELQQQFKQLVEHYRKIEENLLG